MTGDETQKAFFANGEGDAWYQRNLDAKGLHLDVDREEDPILKTIKFLDLPIGKTLEIGCSDGWRLEAIRQDYDCKVIGVEPSKLAIDTGKKKYPNIEYHEGTAENLPFDNSCFQGVILGFCLYLCDPSELFKIVAEIDRIIEQNGWLIILDFCPPDNYKNSYKHAEGIFSYKMDHAALFKANPIYMEQFSHVLPHDEGLGMQPDNRIMVSVLRKFPQYAFPTKT